MATQIIQINRDKAEVFHGDEICKKKIMELLADHSLPLGLLPLDEVEEVGHNKENGFVWAVQKKKRVHTFEKIKQVVSYATELTGFVEKRRFNKLTGVKAREFLLWLTVTDVYIDDPASEKITFKTGTGLADVFPVTAFEVEG